nr:tetratricopeptide repeat protein [Pseudomonadota bacterium]
MAIDDLLNEHEQSEQVRSWVRNNAVGLIGGIVLGLGAIAGWQWWQDQQQQNRMVASGRYSEVVAAFEKGTLPSTDKTRATIDALSKSNPTLGALAALQLAKSHVDAGKPENAIVILRNLPQLDPDMRAVVHQRLARLLVDAGKSKEALELLDDERNPAMLDVRGDAQMMMGDRAKAGQSYSKALGLIDVGDPQHRLLRLKLIEAGGTPPHTKDN